MAAGQAGQPGAEASLKAGAQTPRRAGPRPQEESRGPGSGGALGICFLSYPPGPDGPSGPSAKPPKGHFL